MSGANEQSVDKPWGLYRVLFRDKGFCVKHIEVKPGQRLSLQRHFRRSEEWVITRGEGLVQIGDTEKQVSSGDAVRIEIGEVHRIKNIGQEQLIMRESDVYGVIG